jgi:uncharacterized phage protein (TIGR01671 family)|nr:MAG TPA: YopX protein [Caudoviricetes sp.]
MVTERKRGMKMQDRYLFKAKRKDNGEWVEGFYFCMTHTDGRHTHHFIIPLGADLSLGTPVEKIQVEVDQSTICQCTGLKDKNGKLIFENDILSGHIDVEFPEDETRKRVVWHENGWCTNETGCDDYEELDDFDSENFEVIGNKIDNPELLEV